jgi:hypothetical protein
MKEVKIGSSVNFVDSKGREHNALVTCVHGPGDQNPAVNLVYVSPDPERGDGFGRQIERSSSAVHKNSQSAHGNYWYFSD